MSRENLDNQLTRLAQANGMPDLRLDAEGHFFARIDGAIDLALEFDAGAEALTLTASCGRLPDTGREAVLAALLDANYHWAGSGGATLATRSTDGAVFLQFREPTAHLEAERLQDLLQAVIMNAEFWAQRIETIAAQPAAAAPATAAQAAPTPFTFLRA